MSCIKDNLEQVRENIENALIKIGRKDKITLVAATKFVLPKKIIEAIKNGVDTIGENRVQEANEKFKIIKEKINWHLIGHLQRNKVKSALTIFDMIQSIDKIETALEIDKRAEKPVDILIEINSSREITKYGIEPNKLFSLVDKLSELEKINIKGLMTIGPLTNDEKMIRKAFTIMRNKFNDLKEKRKDLDIQFLSMGMSGDYEIAIDEGSNMVRIGTAIFGERSYV